MEIPPAPPDADETLATIGHRIYRSFGSLEVESRSNEPGDSFASAILNEFQRFGLWAKNLDLYDLGHGSLDYRFRDAPVVKKYASHLLIDLEKSILKSGFPIRHFPAKYYVSFDEAILLYVGITLAKDLKVQQDLDRRTPGREIAAERLRSLGKFSDQAAGRVQEYDEDQGSDESSEDEDELMSYQEDSISTIALENARLIIDRLYKLSFKIRNPATRLGFSKARSYREIDEQTGVDLMDWYASFDLQHVAEILARYWRRSPKECESHYLVKRLASANTHRRRQFGQWRRHKLKLENVLSNFSQGSEKGAFSLPSTATILDEKNFRLSDTASAASSSTYASSFTGDDENEINIPPLPEKLYSGKEFECPYCYVLCSKRMSQKKEWERHVLRDIRPYVCTYEDCTEADQQYDNIIDWVSHEVNAHRDTKLQPADPSGQSSAGPVKDPTESLPQTSHPNSLKPSDMWREECPVCLAKTPNLSHAALHLKKIAVFALPNITGPDEESTRGNLDSGAANIDDLPCISSLGAFEMPGNDDLDEDETDDDWKKWDQVTTRDIDQIEETRHQDVWRFENALQQVNRSTEIGPAIDTFVAGVEPDNTMLHQGAISSDGLTSESYQPIRVSLDDLSFYARIDPLEPNYHAQPIRRGAHNFWNPPNVKTGYNRKPGMLFHWRGGIMNRVGINHPVGSLYSAATVFTQNPDTPHVLVVPFDAQTRHAYQNPGGWKPLAFHHVRVNNTQHTYSYVSATGDRQHIAAPGSLHWMDQLLPRVYDHPTGSPRIQAGLIGSIPLLIALAAFSVPPAVLSPMLTTCIRPRAWQPHQYQYPDGHIAERGMVVTIFLDPDNPQGSNPELLNGLQNGEFGPFYR